MAKKKSLAQDSYRESILITHCGLKKLESRMGRDAVDDLGNHFELKTSTKSDSYVSTARDVSLDTIFQKWEQQYWIVCTGDEFVEGDQKEFVMRQMYICHPSSLRDEFHRIKQPLLRRQFVVDYFYKIFLTDSVLQTYHKELEELVKRGMTLNDPKLNIQPFKSNGLKLDHTNSSVAQHQIKDYVFANPLNGKRNRKSAFDKFFT